MRARTLCLLVCCLSFLGCASSYPESAYLDASETESPAAYATNVSPSEASGNSANGAGANDSAANNNESVADARKIIYDANVRLIVKDFAATESRLPGLVSQFDGYMADVTVSRTSGRNRSGTWKARIPSGSFEAFLKELGQLGVPENIRQTAEDVTAEYVDLQARITNKKRLEQRIIELLEVSKGKIGEIIEVERELARVRGEIEQAEGRLRYLANKTRFSTVTVNVIEQQDYVPPQTPTFASQLAQVWNDSLGQLLACGQLLLMFVVGATPWALVGLVLLLPFIWLIVRQRRASRTIFEATMVDSPSA